MYCILCKKIGRDFNEQRCDCGIPLSNCTLTKPDDKNFIKISDNVLFLEYDEMGIYKETHTTPKVGFSLLMSPYAIEFTWLTTIIEEIIEDNEKDGVKYLKFRTMNSLYELYYINFSDITIKTYDDIKK